MVVGRMMFYSGAELRQRITPQPSVSILERDHSVCPDSLSEVIIVPEPAGWLDNNNPLHLQNVFPLRSAKQFAITY